MAAITKAEKDMIVKEMAKSRKLLKQVRQADKEISEGKTIPLSRLSQELKKRRKE